LRPAPDAEKEVGIEWYATFGEPCRALAKASPDDFVVSEQANTTDLVTEEKPGYYPFYRVEKRSIDTLHMAEELSSALKSRVSYGGMKDKKARSVQFVTPTSLRSERPAKVSRERFTADLVGYVPKPISRAAVAGNRFDITLRDCCPQISESIEEAMRLAERRGLPNFYGLQRFGASGAGTHRIGKALVKADFEGAVRLMLFADRPSDNERTGAAREAMAAGRYEEGAGLLPPGRDSERRVARELGRHPGDWVRALRAVQVRVRRLYVQAYQSLLFNRTLSAALEKGEDLGTARQGDNWAELSADGLVTSRVRGVRDPMAPGAVPMVQIAGYAFRDYGSRFDACLKPVLAAEEVAPREFFLQEMQEVSSEGGFRRPHLAIREPGWDVEGSTARLRFVLGRGQYATVLLREVIKPDDPAAAGLA
jgi:tRNA pseudouridine13 synthase